MRATIKHCDAGPRLARRGLFALLLVGCVLPLASASAQDGGYVGIGPAVVTFDGDFDGTSEVFGDGIVEIIPEFDPGPGIVVTSGYQVDTLVVEVNATFAKLDANFFDVNTTGNFFSLSLDLKKRFFNDARFSPYLSGGAGMRSINVEDGSTDSVNVADAEFSGGVEWRLGGGVIVRLTRVFQLDLQALYRLSDVSEVEGLVDANLVDDLNSNGVTLLASFRYWLGKGRR